MKKVKVNSVNSAFILEQSRLTNIPVSIIFTTLCLETKDPYELKSYCKELFEYLAMKVKDKEYIKSEEFIKARDYVKYHNGRYPTPNYMEGVKSLFNPNKVDEVSDKYLAKVDVVCYLPLVFRKDIIDLIEGVSSSSSIDSTDVFH